MKTVEVGAVEKFNELNPSRSIQLLGGIVFEMESERGLLRGK